MSGRNEVNLDVARNRNRTLVADRLQQPECTGGIRRRIERQGRLVLRVAVPVGVGRVLFLDLGRIGQYQCAQVARARRAIDPPSEPLCHQARQVAGMIEVRMRQDHRMNRRGFNREWAPVALAQGLQPLKETAVNENPLIAGIEQVLRSGHGTGRAEKGQCRHRALSSSALYPRCADGRAVRGLCAKVRSLA